MENIEREYYSYRDLQANNAVIREIIIKAFKELRKQGFIARANYLCCSSCASSQISIDYEEMDEKKKAKIKGCVYWHHQDEPKEEEDSGFTLRYSALGKDDSDAAMKAIGEIIAATMRQHGLTVNWNGDPNTVIYIVDPMHNEIVQAIERRKELKRKEREEYWKKRELERAAEKVAAGEIVL